MDDVSDRVEDRDARARAAWQTSPLSMLVATVGGLGHLPLAPGTWGTIAALPPLVAGTAYSPAVRIGVLALVVAVAVPSATRAGRALGESDSSRIVIDEFVGMGMTLVWFTDLSWAELLVGFAAFRFFDVMKPPGAQWLHTRRDGTGVVGDDLVAALWALPVVVLLRWALL